MFRVPMTVGMKAWGLQNLGGGDKRGVVGKAAMIQLNDNAKTFITKEK